MGHRILEALEEVGAAFCGVLIWTEQHHDEIVQAGEVFRKQLLVDPQVRCTETYVLNLLSTAKFGILRRLHSTQCAPVAQLDRATGYEPVGRVFESLRAHHSSISAPNFSIISRT